MLRLRDSPVPDAVGGHGAHLQISASDANPLGGSTQWPCRAYKIWMCREPFYSSQDLDSEGGESKFFVWTLEEIRIV